MAVNYASLPAIYNSVAQVEGQRNAAKLDRMRLQQIESEIALAQQQAQQQQQAQDRLLQLNQAFLGQPTTTQPMGPPTRSGEMGMDFTPGSGLLGGEQFTPQDFASYGLALSTIPGMQEQGTGIFRSGMEQAFQVPAMSDAEKYGNEMAKLAFQSQLSMIEEENKRKLDKKYDTPSKDATERQLKIKTLVDRGVPKETAEDIVNGVLKGPTPPDSLGRIYVYNMATQKREQIAGPRLDGNDDLGQADDQQNGFQSGLNESGSMPIGQAIERGTGPKSKIKTWINNTIGPFMSGQPFEGTEEAKTAIGLFNQEAKQALVNNARFPVAEQELVAKMLPDAGKFFTDPDSQRERLNQLNAWLGSKRLANSQTLSRGGITTDEMGRLRNQNASIERIQQLMEGGKQNTFLNMSMEDLENVDVNSMSESELLQYLEATK